MYIYLIYNFKTVTGYTFERQNGDTWEDLERSRHDVVIFSNR